MSKAIRGAVIEVVVTAIGWGVCLSMLVGAWTLGWWIASHFDGVSNADRDVFGLLSALAFLWIYGTTRGARTVQPRLCERLDHRGGSL
ncbi:MAG: hypothetical protein WB689_12370 [Xanthobacteraceae bacterium]